jgi:hypothetical protein
MRTFPSITTALLVYAVLTLPAMSGEKAKGPSADERAVRAAVDRWFVVLNAMFAGDPKPFADLYSHADDVTYMGEEGTYRIGWKATYDDWKKQARKSLGGKVHGTKIQIVVDGTMATATHYTKGTIRTPPAPANAVGPSD